MKKLTFKQILEVDLIVARLYKANETLKNSKFGYAYKRYYEKNFKPLKDEFGTLLNEIRINNALEDPKTKEVLTDNDNPRGYKYSKAGLLKCIEEEDAAQEDFLQKEVEIIPFISPIVPEGLEDEEKELLTGAVI